jgi:aminotransferase
VISLGVGDRFRHALDRARSGRFLLGTRPTHYTSNRGDPPCGIHLPLRCPPVRRPIRLEKEVLVTVGVSEAIDVALRTVLNPCDEVLYHEPCFVTTASILLAGGVPFCVETRREDQFRLTRPCWKRPSRPRPAC